MLAEALPFECRTADQYEPHLRGVEWRYLSMGRRRRIPGLLARGVKLWAYWQTEPPVTDPAGWRYMPILRRLFKHVFTDCPLAVEGPIEPLFSRQNRKRLVMVQSNKTSRHPAELYSWRRSCARDWKADVFGYGFDPVESKYEKLSEYDFAICFENQALSGYITEKIFDCLAVGTVPIYLGAPEIATIVPSDCFADLADWQSWSPARVEFARSQMRSYLQSDAFQDRFAPKGWVQRTAKWLVQTGITDLHC